MSKRVTLAQIAQRTGLSVTTVSFALNDRPNTRISPDTTRLIKEAAAEMGYTPDPVARGLRTGKTETIGFISDEVTITRYTSAMIRGVLDAGDERDHLVLMAECGDHPDRLQKALTTMRSRRIDGLLIAPMRARRIDLPPIPKSLPTLVVNGHAHTHPSVLPDEYTAGSTAIEHLLANGHRRIAFIGRSAAHLDPRVSITIPRRLAGIDAGMAKAGLSFQCEIHGADWEPELGYDGALEIFDTHRVTAILTANDRIAWGVFQAAQTRGIAIPEQLSVMSFDDEQLASYLRPRLTTIQLPYLQMGRLAVEALLDYKTAKGRESEILVPMPLIERGSVRQNGNAT